eukprot:CAMPEP_0181198466 /NCGR_PEP_ID=MMETSP1096-20121128/16632_1 /TAXON_ID=156174 ORGANISM="Chrysochromulina ericina, Strain CCMP281" /NCGR_SAMPLE_ID=MMETSP1096 /ASSEMBLY_ACC=CAM_ASM_000453 /LENGTH=161 /DNA_ID=CAMNT_0023288531 /DNA_START=521 /DNA_END=1007 /DNA_ORIENTATION=+
MRTLWPTSAEDCITRTLSSRARLVGCFFDVEITIWVSPISAVGTRAALALTKQHIRRKHSPSRRMHTKIAPATPPTRESTSLLTAKGMLTTSSMGDGGAGGGGCFFLLCGNTEKQVLAPVEVTGAEQGPGILTGTSHGPSLHGSCLGAAELARGEEARHSA